MAHPSTAPWPIPAAQISEHLLWRFAERGHPRAEEFLAELDRREQQRARDTYFSRYAPTTPISAGELTAGNVITGDGGGARMVIRDVYRIPGGRVLATYSLTNLVTGKVDDTVAELPLLTAAANVRLVSRTVPTFPALAVAA